MIFDEEKTAVRLRLEFGHVALFGAQARDSRLFGVGGALIVPPALTAFFGVRQVEGQGLRLPLVAPGSVIALVAYAGAGQVDWRLGIPPAVGGAVSISAGVALAHSLPERRLRFAFCGLFVLIAALLTIHG